MKDRGLSGEYSSKVDGGVVAGVVNVGCRLLGVGVSVVCVVGRWKL